MKTIFLIVVFLGALGIGRICAQSFSISAYPLVGCGYIDSTTAHLYSSGGVAPITFFIDTMTVVDSTSNAWLPFTVGPLLSGSYLVLAIDALGDTAITTLVIPPSYQNYISSIIIGSPCGNGADSVKLKAYIANPGNLSWSPFMIGCYSLNIGVYGDELLLTNVPPGVYQIEASYYNCDASLTLDLTQKPDSNYILNTTFLSDSSCYNGLSSVAVAPSNLQSCTYSWSNGSSIVANSDSALALPLGIYTVTSTTASGCTSSKIYSLQGAAHTWLQNSDSVCVNEGVHILQQFGAGYTSAYPITIMPTTGVVGNHINAPSSGIYTLTTSDPSICTATHTYSYFVQQPSSSIQLTTSPSSCPLTPDGSIGIVSAPSNNNLVAQWSNGKNNIFLDSLLQGSYNVLVADTSNGGCIYLVDTIIAIDTSCGSICGSVFYDNNANCLADTNDLKKSNRWLSIQPGNYSALTNNQGDFSLAGLSFGTYTVTSGIGTNSAMAICASSQVVTIDTSNSTATVTFFDSVSNIVDYSIGGSVPCLNFASNNISANLFVTKNGASTALNASCTVYMVFDSINQLASAIPAPNSFNGDTAFWQLSNSNYSTNIKLYFNISQFTPLGNFTTINCGIMNMAATDNQLFNNTFSATIQVCNSYDPNDKQVQPQGSLSMGYVPAATNLFRYHINFQNTGNFSAANVALLDTLDTNLDMSTLQVDYASHAYQVQALGGNTVKFLFAGIMLPDSASNEVASHGYIGYSVRKKPNVPDTAAIENTAHIYFDYNAPVTTNTTVTTLYDTLVSSIASIAHNTACNAVCGNGAIVMNRNGGAGIAHHSILPSCSAIVVQGDSILHLPTGTYTVTTTDEIGNTTSQVISIQSPTAININLNITQPTSNLGSAFVSPTGGTAPYNYLYMPGNTTSYNILNASNGTYTVTVTDAFGCSASNTFMLAYPLGVSSVVDGGISIFPNPANDELRIESNYNIEKIEMLNTYGQLVYSCKEIELIKLKRISVAHLPAGNYVVRINSSTNFVVTLVH